ncbi:cation diffusion facilitator family transporter [Oscillatoria amoena NRMC-F 0135]|nr:cation diffusion facilitator family transporter [Oscillatoria amoena NRMC-F 0135]
MTTSYKQAFFATWLGIGVNLLCAILKLAGGIIGQSTALIADGLESLSDIGSSLVLLIALQIARRPADPNHPYGHGRAESLGSVVVAMTLIAVAILIIWNATTQLIRGEYTVPTGIALWIAVFSIIAKETLYQYKARLARRIKSSALMADAWHHRSDALSSVATLAAIGIAMYWGGQIAWIDPAAAILIGVIIAAIGVKGFFATAGELMDEQNTPELVARIRELSSSEKGVLDVEKIRVRKSGLTYHVDLHLEVAPEMPVIESHDLGHRVQRKLIRELDGVTAVLVHIEPHRPGHQPIEQF